MILVVVLFVASVTAAACTGAADGTPCICIASPNPVQCGNGVFLGSLSSGVCIHASGGITCDDGGTLTVGRFCCQSCGDSDVGISGSVVEDCDPPTFVTGTGQCCGANCKFSPANAACSPDTTVCTLDICDGTSASCTHPVNPSPPGSCESDSIECTNDVCSGTTCSHTPNTGAACTLSGSPACTSAFCLAGSCGTPISGGPGSCNSGLDGCPADSCSAGTCVNAPGCGGGSADPHIFGPFGEKFEFNGQAGGVYNMIASRQVVVNAQMMVEGPTNHYMTKIGVMFANVTLTFDTVNRPANYLDKLNALLEPVGAHATGNKYSTTLHLCDGQLVEITQMHSGQFYFLDVAFDAVGCHDEFAGVIGQLYQCAYSAGSFVWDSKNEESFRIASLHSIAGSFDSSAACYQRHEYGTAFPAKK